MNLSQIISYQEYSPVKSDLRQNILLLLPISRSMDYKINSELSNTNHIPIV